METIIGGEARLFYGLGSTDLQAVGKRRLEWDPSDWKWDGNLFIASPLAADPSTYNDRQFFPPGTGTGNATAIASSNSSSSCSDEMNPAIQTGKKESEKRPRVIVVDDDNLDDEVATLTLKLGGHGGYPMTERDAGNWNGTSGKKTKLTGTTSNRSVCQVDDCGADLSKAKDYHRRHKVCEMHSKASRALVGNVMQRFCQQCSRFHALQEFDDGKRSCRRRLAGHNKRRRKTQADAVMSSTPSNDNQASAYLLISLLKILSNMHARMNYTDDQDLLSHLLSSLGNHDGLNGDKYISGLLRESQNLLNNKPSNANSEVVSLLPANGPQGPSRPKQQNCVLPSSDMPQKKLHVNDERDEDIIIASSQKQGVTSPTQDSPPEYAQIRGSSAGRSKLNNFDLNDVYIDSGDCIEDAYRSPIPLDLGNVCLECPSWVQQDSHQSSPLQTSGNSDSGSAQSASSSSGEARSRTDRIVFKLFGKEPSDFPFILRGQILDWLSHSPTDIEGYIRPGCIVLTIYLRMPEFVWEEICYDLSSSLSRLLDVSDEETFWRTGWLYIRVQNQFAFIYNGQVVVDTSLPFEMNHYSTVLSVKPIAVSASKRAQFTVKGFNISRPSTRILCALEGNYLDHEAYKECLDDQKEHDEFECLNFSCTIPAVTGRGLIEVEDFGLSSSSFPFIVADKDVCSEIRMLESEIELTSTADLQGGIGKMHARNLAMDFIHEMGWLLHRTQLKSRLGHLYTNADLFSFKRFKWLIEFSMDHEWCAVVKKLLDISFVGMVGAGEHSSLSLALLDIGLLHRAVRKNSRPMVELLLKYVPEKVAVELRLETKSPIGNDGSFLFRPDAVGPAGLTPLHIAAGRDGSDIVLDVLTNDPRKVGVEAWKNVQDSAGFTPEDYARLRGHFSYIHLVQRKISTRAVPERVVLDIPIASVSSECNVKQKPNEGTASFQIGMAQKSCRACDLKLACGHGSRSLLYRPAMLSMVVIAAVCVCVALLFKSSPEVLFVFHPFRWEMLEFGSI